jgi:hypothetical protein
LMTSSTIALGLADCSLRSIRSSETLRLYSTNTGQNQ